MIEKGAIKKSTMQAIVDAVKAKEGSTDLIPVNALADRIAALKIASGTNKLAQVIDRSVTEITAEDLAGVTEIGEYAFNNCKRLTRVTIPDGVTRINRYGLGNCYNLKSVTIPSSVITLASYAFSGSSNEELHYEGELWRWCFKVVKDSVASLVCGRFYIKGELLEDAVIENVPSEALDNYAYRLKRNSFVNCSSIKTFTLKDMSHQYLTGNGDYLFVSCKNLTTVKINSVNMCGANVNDTKQMSINMFNDCPNLKDIYVVWSEGEIANAPWGGTVATIHYDTPYTLTIDGEEYTAIAKLTWAEWCNSEYNTGGFYVGDDGLIYQSAGKYLYRYDGASYCPQGTHKMNRHETYKVSGN